MAWKVSADPLDFEEAIAWFRKRVKVTREEWDAMTAAARYRAFVVSNIAQLDLVVDAWAAIDAAIAKGTTLADFKKDVAAKLRKAWAGEVEDPAWRLETIFRTNVQNAYGAGRYRQATDPDVLEDRPVWMFDAVLDGRETDVCRACDGTKQPADNEWWRTHSPPLHFNCRSTLITLTEEQAGRITPLPPGAAAQAGFGKAPTYEQDELGAWAAGKLADAPAPLARQAASNGGPPPPGGGSGSGSGGGDDDSGEHPAHRRLGIPSDVKPERDRLYEARAHSAGGRDAKREAKRGNAVFLFLNGEDLDELERLVWQDGDVQPTVRNHERIALQLDRQLGTRKRRGDKDRPLDVVEIKGRIKDGRWTYHLVPREKPAK